MTLEVGLIGAGRIGHFIGLNLLKAGFRLHVTDLHKSAAGELLEQGAYWHESPAFIAETSQYILLSLFDSNDVADVLSGTQGICHRDLTGKTIIDTTTVPPADARDYAARVAAQNGRYLDAPITGGEGGAQQGTLTIMVGGDADAFAACEAVFTVIGEQIIYLGESGAGQFVKMANQGIMVTTFVSIVETLQYLESAGVDMPGALAVLTQGGTSSPILQNIAARYSDMQGDEAAQTETRHYSMIFEKDARYAWQSAEAIDQPLAMVKQAHAMIKKVTEAETYGFRFPLNILQWMRTRRKAERRANDAG